MKSSINGQVAAPSSTQVHCPGCGLEINVDNLLRHKVEDDLRQQFQKERNEVEASLLAEANELDKTKKELDRQKSELGNTINQQVQQRMDAERKTLLEKIKKDVSSEMEAGMLAMQEELKAKSAQVVQLNQAKAEIEKLKRDNSEMESNIAAQAERKLNEELAKARDEIRKNQETEFNLKLAEREKIINQLKENLSDAQTRAEQGSVQLQGEVQELSIEDYLFRTFPLDTIQPVKKGQKGADALQIINTRMHKDCGRIYYESKRTKAFDEKWIEKLREDMRAESANIGVIVTKTMPADNPHLHQRGEIWVCPFNELHLVCLPMRELIIHVHSARVSHVNKGEKSSLLFDFMSSEAFRQLASNIIKTFAAMQADLAKEKRAMTNQMARREKQLAMIMSSLMEMNGNLSAIVEGGMLMPGADELLLPEAGDEACDE